MDRAIPPPTLRHDPAGPSWVLAWGGIRLSIVMQSGALVCDDFGPATDAVAPKLWANWREHGMRLNARLPAMVAIGPRPLCLTWRLAGWALEDPWTLVIQLAAEDAALTCEQRFTVDPATGLLLRTTTQIGRAHV